MVNVKIFLITLLLLIFVGDSVQARHSTENEIKMSLSYSVESVRKTDNYRAYVLKEKFDYQKVLQQKKVCTEESAILKAIREEGSIGGNEAATCLALAYLIVELRRQVLTNFIDGLNAHVNGNMTEFEYYTNEYIDNYKNADKWRIEFKTRYGY